MPDREIPTPGELVRSAYRKVEAERQALFRIGAIPAALQFLIYALLRPQDPADPSTLIAGFLLLIPATLFDVAWLRRLLGADAGDPPLPYRWGRRHTGYVIRFMLLILLLATPIMFVAMVLGQIAPSTMPILLVAGAVVCIYLLLRLSMILVAQAVDRPCDSLTSWSATREGAVRMFWGTAFVALPLLVGVKVLIMIADAAGVLQLLPLVTTLALVVLSLAMRAVFLAVIAQVFAIRMAGNPVVGN